MNQETSPSKGLEWVQGRRIAVPSPDHEKYMAIRHFDWKRLRRTFSKATTPSSRLPQVYSIFTGVGMTALLSIYPIAVSIDTSKTPWVIPLYACVGIFSLLVAGVFFLYDRQGHSKRQLEHQEIEVDMDGIEDMFVE